MSLYRKLSAGRARKWTLGRYCVAILFTLEMFCAVRWYYSASAGRSLVLKERAAVVHMESVLDGLRLQCDMLQDELKMWQEGPLGLERLVRFELGLARPHEHVFIYDDTK